MPNEIYEMKVKFDDARQPYVATGTRKMICAILHSLTQFDSDLFGMLTIEVKRVG